MYKAKYLQPRPITGPDTILHLKPYAGLASASTLFDYSLNNHPGTLKGTATLKYPGCDLDGDGDYIEIADHADFTPTLTPLSIRAWVFMHDATFFSIATKGIINTLGEWRFWTNDVDKIEMVYVDNNTADCYIGRKYNTALAENQWLHVVATYSGGTVSSSVRLHLGGTRVDDADKAGVGGFVTVRNLAHAIEIGRYDIFYANGLIDEVIIEKAEWSTTKIRSDYEATRSRYGV